MMNDKEESFLAQWLQRMTLRQKLGQMTMAERLWATPADVKEYALGALLSGGGSHPDGNSPEAWVAMNDGFWQAAVEDPDSLGIPTLFGIDAVHGHNNLKGATIFPHNIGLGAAGDARLVADVARATAREILATGLEWDFAPTLAVAQNCRWGRTYESFGNDPQAVGELGAEYIRAMQEEGVMACAKHWVGDGGTGQGRDQGETTLAWEALEATHVVPYYAALKAGVLSVMASFNSWNGVKCHGHHFLLTELLKGRLGFEGIVISDWDGVQYLDPDYGIAIAKSVNAGLDMFMVPEHWKEFIDALEAQVQQGQVSMERIDDAVRRILRTKLRYGLFNMPRPKLRKGVGAVSPGCREHRDIARAAVRKSLVLLKNEQSVLPLAPHQRILVAGKNAHNLGHQCGGWTLSWQGENGNDTIAGTSVWEGLRDLMPEAELSADLSGAEADARRHEAAVVVIGEKPYAEGFGDIRPADSEMAPGSMANTPLGPIVPYAQSLKLAQVHPEDLECIQRIASKGIAVIAVLLSGRPLVVNDELAASTAFVAGWLPGTEGLGLAEVLLGQYDFTGRLPLPWPRSVEIAEEPDSRDAQLFPRGYGLSLQAEASAAIKQAVG